MGVYNLIENLQSALSEDITLPEPFELVMQTDNGVQTIKTDESGEKHAIVNFDFMGVLWIHVQNLKGDQNEK